jgi:hypothetical protein
MTPIGWGLAGLVWGYALLAFMITDVLKIHFFRLAKHSDVGMDTKPKEKAISPTFPQAPASAD